MPQQLPDGVTPRTLGYWIDQGWIPLDDTTPGRGHPRQWTDKAWRKLAAMGRLRKLGVEAQLSNKIAQEIIDAVDYDRAEIDLDHGMSMVVDTRVFFEELEPMPFGVNLD